MAAPMSSRIAPSGDTRCPAWCDQSVCFPELCHRSYSIEVETGEATVSLWLRQWRADEELQAPGWAPAHLTYSITHKTELVDEDYDQGIRIVQSEPMPLDICFGVSREELRTLVAAQAELLALLEQDGGVGHG